MKKVRSAVVWLVLLVLVVACTLSGCKKDEPEATSGTGAASTQPADPNA